MLYIIYFLYFQSESGEKSGPASRLSSATSLGGDDLPNRPTTPSLPNENGELDYKKVS